MVSCCHAFEFYFFECLKTAIMLRLNTVKKQCSY